jgi:two-component system, OmpR family, alkaline phosphatase synthesis response regulator PhoP
VWIGAIARDRLSPPRRLRQHDDVRPHAHAAPAVATAAARASAAQPPLSGRVLLIEREHGNGRVEDALRGAGLAVERPADGRSALDRARTEDFALVVLDIEAPGVCGIEGCRQIRVASDVPIMIRSARGSEADRVLGLDAGADDFVGTAMSMNELTSRVRALLRRRGLDARAPAQVHRVGDVEIDRLRHTVTVAAAEVPLTPTEFRLLAFLATEPGRAFTPQEILHHLWQSDHVGRGSACKAHISNLRRKIEADPARPERLVTVRGAGYALSPGPLTIP